MAAKALSKAGKLKIKRAMRRAKVGRPFIEGVAREPNGRISRAITPPEPADKLALTVRARQLGVSVEAARDPRLGTYIGRLSILGVEARGGEGETRTGSVKNAGGISREQYDAAQTFLEVRNNYLRAILSPAAVYDERIALTDGETQEEAAKRDIARYEAALRAVQAAQLESPTDNLYAALQCLVIEDKELPYMVGTLRLVLNALHRHFF